MPWRAPRSSRCTLGRRSARCQKKASPRQPAAFLARQQNADPSHRSLQQGKTPHRPTPHIPRFRSRRVDPENEFRMTVRIYPFPTNIRYTSFSGFSILSNPSGMPRSRGTRALISGFTLTAPVAMRSTAFWYSPVPVADEPIIVFSPMRVRPRLRVWSCPLNPTIMALPPRRVHRAALRAVSGAPAVSKTTSGPCAFGSGRRRTTWSPLFVRLRASSDDLGSASPSTLPLTPYCDSY